MLFRHCKYNSFKIPIELVLFVFCLSFSNTTLIAQLREGFDPEEAESLIAICNSFTFLEVYGSDTLIIPKEYVRTYTSEAIGLDNIFQVYEKDSIGVINFRGSTTNRSSWVENVFSAMIAAEGVIKIDKEKYPYKFAKDNGAAVHSGYALAVMLLRPLIIEQINKLNAKGIYQILITGHSQGGALANLCRAYLENLPKGKISPRNTFKTYAFANPMCGNHKFAEEYNQRYSEKNMSYSIINPTDIVPKLPTHFQQVGTIMSNQGFKNGFTGFGLICKLEPFPIPRVQVDPLIMTKKEISRLRQDQDGNYYKNENILFQHRPYQYYLAILKKYNTREYREVEFLFLPENIDSPPLTSHMNNGIQDIFN